MISRVWFRLKRASLGIEHPWLRPQLEVFGGRLPIAVVEPRRQTLRRREQVDELSMMTLAAIQMGAGTTEYAVGWFTLALINAGLAQNP